MLFSKKLPLVLLALALCAHLSARGPSFLFVGFDAGETAIWEEVLKEWDLAPQSHVLMMATAAQMTKNKAVFAYLNSEQKHVLDGIKFDRLTSLTDQQIKETAAIDAAIVITGMYSKAEEEIAENFYKRGACIVSFWDNPSSFDRLPPELTASVAKIVSVSHVILTPTEEIACDINKRFTTDKAMAIGQPSIEAFTKNIKSIDPFSIRHNKIIPFEKRTLVYFGGYEEKSNRYNEAFTLFVEGIKNAGEDYELLVQLHPKAVSGFEKDLLERYASQCDKFPRYFVSLPGRDYNAIEAASISSLVATHRSTLGIPCFLAGKPVMYVDVEGTMYTNCLIEKGFSPQLTSPLAIQNYLSCKPENLFVIDPAQQTGLLFDSTQKVRDYLKSLQPCAEE